MSLKGTLILSFPLNEPGIISASFLSVSMVAILQILPGWGSPLHKINFPISLSSKLIGVKIIFSGLFDCDDTGA